jgi:ketosteroid isomerase-like protein
MSLTNIEVVRRSFEAFGRRDFDAVIKDWAERGEWRPALAGAVEGRVYRGRNDIRRYFDELFASFADVSTQDVEYRDFGDRVLALYKLTVRGRDSDVVVDQPGAIVYELSNGEIVSAASYLSWDEALSAAGATEA